MDEESLRQLQEPLTKREIEVLDRIANGLTDREIAESLVISVATVKWHNRQIYSKLGASNRTAALTKARALELLEAGAQRHAPSKRTARPRHNLPVQITSFVGRERRIGEIRRILQGTRLLTLTGPPGTGKTRLALRVAEAMIDVFEHGVYLVDLAPINRPDLVPATIAGALDIQEAAGRGIAQNLKRFLSDKELLLLLDNFEHVIEAASVLVDLLSAAPRLSVLVTSREALQVYGEQEYPVPPLTLPDMNRPEPARVLQGSEAGALFMQRARAVRPDFNLTDEEAPAVAEICVRLDGLPLAIELAAARVKVFSPAALLGQLKSRLTGLKTGPRGLPDRQRTLRGAFDWSYELLDEAERTLFARLSVFQGGRTIEAAEVVCSNDLTIDVVDGLESLLNKSLLQREEGFEGEPRLVMLETIHEYAREQLDWMRETEALRRRHAEYFAVLTEKAAPFIRGGSRQLLWLRRLEAEHDNLRTALAWSLGGGDEELGLRMVGSLGHFWFRQGHYAEGQRWTTRALEIKYDDSTAVRANVLRSAGLVAFYSYDQVTGKDMFREALALYRQLNDKREIGWSLIWLGGQSIGQPDEYVEGTKLLEEGLLLLKEANDKAGVCQALNALAELARHHGDYGRARRACDEGLQVAREIGDKLREALFLFDLGLMELYSRQVESATRLFNASLSLAIVIGYRPQILHALAALAGALEAQGQAERGAQLLGAAEALFDSYGFGLQPTVVKDIEGTKARLQMQLSRATFGAAMAKGKAMNLEQAIALAPEERGPATAGRIAPAK